MLCIGVRPESGLAKDSQLALNPRGYITVNDYMQTSDPCVYAVGDVIETRDLVFPERRATVALGNNANMQARIAADHIVRGQSLPFKGALGTSIVRVFDTVLALTGWTERRLSAAGVAYSSAIITENNHAGYYPGATPITLKVVFDPASGRVFGAQAGEQSCCCSCEQLILAFVFVIVQSASTASTSASTRWRWPSRADSPSTTCRWRSCAIRRRSDRRATW